MLGDAVAVDRFSVVATIVLVLVAAFGCVYAWHESGRAEVVYRGEFYPLLLFATAGMTLIVAANDLIVVFLALEILSLSLYVLTGIGRAAQQRGRDEVLPAGGVLLGVLPVRGRDGLRRHDQHEDHDDRGRARRPDRARRRSRSSRWASW